MCQDYLMITLWKAFHCDLFVFFSIPIFLHLLLWWSTLAELSHCRPLDPFSPSPVECVWGCGPHRVGGAAAWAQSTQRAPPEIGGSLEEWTICTKRDEGTCPCRTGKCAKYRRTPSGIPAWTRREKKLLDNRRFTYLQYKQRSHYCVIGSNHYKDISISVT